MKTIINSIVTARTGYGQWNVTVNCEGGEHFTAHSTNSHAIDGKDGYEVRLAKDAIVATGKNIEDFDYSLLKDIED